jgi:hypothetical protein
MAVSDNDKRSSLLLRGVIYSKKVLQYWPQFVGVADFEKWKKKLLAKEADKVQFNKLFLLVICEKS